MDAAFDMNRHCMHKCYCFFLSLIFEVNCCFHKLLVLFKFLGSASKEPAAWYRLNTICSAIGWKAPLYEFEEQGPLRNKL